MPTTKEAVIAAVDDAWRDLRRSLSPLTAADMDIPGVCGEWSVKDVLGHVTTWEAELIQSLAMGRALPSLAVDAFNQAAAVLKRRLSHRELMEQLEETHRSLRDALNGTPSSYFEPGESLREKIDADSVLHYDEHAAQIRAWLKGRQRGEE